jgi:hypothetical protein
VVDVNGSDGPLWKTAALAVTPDIPPPAEGRNAGRSSFRTAFSFGVILFAVFLVVLLFFAVLFLLGIVLLL